MKFTLRQLRYALAAAKHGNLTTAAMELHVSQPSISAAITELEEVLGQSIFIRQRGLGISLTPFGRTVMVQARRVLAEAQTFAEIHANAGECVGELVVGCFEDLAPYCLPQIVRRMQEACPRVTVDMRDGSFDYVGKRLSEGAIELAITYDLGLPPNTQCTPLCQLTAQVLLAADHPLAKEPRVSLKALAEYTLVVTDQAQSWQHVLDLFSFYDLSPAVVHRVRTFELQRSLVANGFGVALIYTRPFGDRSYDGQALVCRPTEEKLPTHSIVLAHDQRYPLTPSAEAFKELAVAWFAERPSFASE
ncbi:LysR family transcriptional regulator [Pseudomonas sp. TWI929]|uniref:LysR family transcriptional regulator n=1 Tax=Pseudomonas sp. TWI929 TaxID=3136795 RepID=UPI0032084D4D